MTKKRKKCNGCQENEVKGVICWPQWDTVWWIASSSPTMHTACSRASSTCRSKTARCLQFTANCQATEEPAVNRNDRQCFSSNKLHITSDISDWRQLSLYPTENVHWTQLNEQTIKHSSLMNKSYHRSMIWRNTRSATESSVKTSTSTSPWSERSRCRPSITTHHSMLTTLAIDCNPTHWCAGIFTTSVTFSTSTLLSALCCCQLDNNKASSPL